MVKGITLKKTTRLTTEDSAVRWGGALFRQTIKLVFSSGVPVLVEFSIRLLGVCVELHGSMLDKTRPKQD